MINFIIRQIQSERLTMTVKALAVLLAASFSAVAGPVTIVSVLGGGGGCLCSLSGTQPDYVSWTQNGTFTGVTVQADLGEIPGDVGSATGVAYLTNQVGTGTTSSNQVAGTSPFSISITNTTAALTTLFSGLTLGPGTYYLTINLTDDAFGWEGFATSPSSTVTTASGVTANPIGECFGGTSGSCTPASYPPASATFTTKSPAFLLYQVTGTAASGVPEPATAGLMLAALGIGVLLLRRR
jgi:hypothetical protein